MALRRVALLAVIALAAATLELRPWPLTPGHVVLTSATRIPPPQLVAVEVSSTTITPTDVFSVALEVAECASCYVTVILYQADSAAALPTGASAGGLSATMLMTGTAGGEANHFNTSFPGGSSYSGWRPLLGGYWPNGQYFMAVRVRDINSDLNSFFTASDVLALGVGAITLTGSDQATPYPWVTVDYFDITPRTVSAHATTLSVNVRVAGRQMDYGGAFLRLYCAPTRMYTVGQLYHTAYFDTRGWANISAPLDGDWVSSSGDLADLQTGVRSCTLTVTAIRTGQALVVITPAQLTASGFDPTFTLTGAAFSSDAETPPACNFTFGSAAPVPAGGQLRINGVCNKPVYSRVMFRSPAVSPPQLLSTGYRSQITSLNQGIDTEQGYAAGNYLLYSVAVTDAV